VQDRIDHARAYPFAIPPASYLFDDGRVRALDALAIDRRRLVPVLAAGSNQSPAQLARKYDGLGATIAAERGILHDFDTVYAAKLARYGSVPATFQASPGCATTVFVLWLDTPGLARMHQTEALYSFDHLSDIRVTLDDGAGSLTEAFAYSSRVGCLNIAGACVALAAIAARGRRFTALDQPGIQARLRDRLAPDLALDAFIAGHLGDDDLRRRYAAMLAEDALALDFPRRTLREL
jgi:hypothetical protein